MRATEEEVIAALEKEIRQASADGFNISITGMALGVDIWAAEIVLRLRDASEAVRLICACPYQGFERGWKLSWQVRYQAILSAADLVRFICPGYSRSCFQRRNEWMVDHAARVIAVWNGQPSGTKNTIDYAKRHFVPVVYPLLIFQRRDYSHKERNSYCKRQVLLL